MDPQEGRRRLARVAGGALSSLAGFARAVLLLAAAASVGLPELAAAAGTAAGDAPRSGAVAAVVEGIIGEGVRVQLKDSEGKSSSGPLRLFQQLHEGDEIIIDDHNGVVQVAIIGSAEHHTILHKQSPFRIPAPGAQPSYWRNVGDKVVAGTMAFVSQLWSDHEEAPLDTIAAISRAGTSGGGMSAPIFQRDGQRVVAGDRLFTVAWLGGAPPYIVDIKREGSAEPLLRREALSTPELPPTRISLLPGRHALIIRDKDYAHTLRHAFLVVEEGTRPSPGQPSPFAGTPPDAAATLAAVWLAAQDDGAWSLESVQQVGDLARGGYQPAVLLRDRLLFTGQPVELPEGTR